MEIVIIKRQALPKIVIDKNYMRKPHGGGTYVRTRVVDVDNIYLNIAPYKYSTTAIILIKFTNNYYYSETFNKYYKTLSKEDREDITECMYFDNTVHTQKRSMYLQRQLHIKLRENTYIIGDWGKVKILDR